MQQHPSLPAGSFLKAAECAAELQQAAQADEWGQTGALQQAQAGRGQALHQASLCWRGCHGHPLGWSGEALTWVQGLDSCCCLLRACMQADTAVGLPCCQAPHLALSATSLHHNRLVPYLSPVLKATSGCFQALRQQVDSAVAVNPQQLQVFPSSLGGGPGESNVVWKALEVSGESVDWLAAQLLQSSSHRLCTVRGARAMCRANRPAHGPCRLQIATIEDALYREGLLPDWSVDCPLQGPFRVHGMSA